MGYFRNLFCFSIFALIITGCGGGNSAIATNDSGASGTATGGGNSSNNTGTLTLKWIAPTTMSDGTAISLSNISGYKLFYGTSATDTSHAVSISDGTATQFTIPLPSGKYYFAICAIDSNGHQGLMSATIQKTI